jgi:sugar lactone lactonase YvrE
MARIPLDAVSFTGDRFLRPECIVTTRRGDIYASDARGGIAHVDPAGVHRIFAGASLDLPVPLHPNGFALDRDGSFIIAHLALGSGGVYRLQRNGQLSPVLLSLDGEELTATNFVMLDRKGRIWITVSTRQNPRTKAFRPDVADGFIVLLDDRGPRIVANEIGFANEIRIDDERRVLYVAESYGKRLTRFDLAEDGSLSGRSVLSEFGAGEIPDGIALDIEGAVWVTCTVANRLIRITPDGQRTVILDGADEQYVIDTERDFQAGRMTKAHIDQAGKSILGNISSLAFGGPDLKTVYMGVLVGDRLPTIRVDIPGRPMIHWDW